jgi:hypothetical protein
MERRAELSVALGHKAVLSALDLVTNPGKPTNQGQPRKRVRMENKKSGS